MKIRSNLETLVSLTWEINSLPPILEDNERDIRKLTSKPFKVFPTFKFLNFSISNISTRGREIVNLINRCGEALHHDYSAVTSLESTRNYAMVGGGREGKR